MRCLSLLASLLQFLSTIHQLQATLTNTKVLISTTRKWVRMERFWVLRAILKILDIKFEVYRKLKFIQSIHKRMVRFQKLTRSLFISLHGTTYTVSSGNCPTFSCAANSSLLMLTAGPRGQFPRWRRSRKRLSVCSVLRCPDL